MRAPGAIILGDLGGHYLRYGGPAHVCVCGPNRSGKGLTTVVPTLLTLPDSVVVMDIKRELLDYTGPWRSRWSHVLVFDPTRDDGVAINPLWDVRPGITEVRDMQQIVDVLAHPSGPVQGGPQDPPHWRETARSFLTGVGLHLLYSAPLRETSLGGMLRFLTQPGVEPRQMAQQMQRTAHLASGPHPVIVRLAQTMLNRDEREHRAILSTATRWLDLWHDPRVDAATSRSTVPLQALTTARNPVSLYLCLPASDLARLQPLLRLLWLMLVRTMTAALPEAHAHPLTLVLDEFAALERMQALETVLPYLPGYGVRLLLIVQSFRQLDQWYGHDHSILDNCDVKVVLQPNYDERTAKRLTEWLGHATAERDQVTHSGSRFGLVLPRLARSRQAVGRALLTADELFAQPPDTVLVFAKGQRPIRARTLPMHPGERYHYTDAALQARLRLSPVISTPPLLPLPAWVYARGAGRIMEAA